MIDQNREHFSGSPNGVFAPARATLGDLELMLLLDDFGKLAVDDFVPGQSHGRGEKGVDLCEREPARRAPDGRVLPQVAGVARPANSE